MENKQIILKSTYANLQRDYANTLKNNYKNTLKNNYNEILEKMKNDYNFKPNKCIEKIINNVNIEPIEKDVIEYKLLLTQLLLLENGDQKVLPLNMIEQNQTINAYMSNYIKIIRKITNDYHVKYITQNMFWIPMSECVYIFYMLKTLEKLNRYYNIYFLGDSVYKFKVMYDILAPDNDTKTISFSGKMFTHSLLDEKYVTGLNENYDNFYTQNKSLIDFLLNDMYKNPIILFDYFQTGESLITFRYVLFKIIEKILKRPLSLDQIDQINQRIIYLNFITHFDVDIVKQVEKIKNEYKMNIILITLDLMPTTSFNFTNSDNLNLSNSCSRCIPKNPYTKWSEHLPDVFSFEDEQLKNYIGCNISNIEIYYWLNFQFFNSPLNITNINLINNLIITDGAVYSNIYLDKTLNKDLIRNLGLTNNIEFNIEDIDGIDRENDSEMQMIKKISRNIIKDCFRLELVQ